MLQVTLKLSEPQNIVVMTVVAWAGAAAISRTMAAVTATAAMDASRRRRPRGPGVGLVTSCSLRLAGGASAGRVSPRCANVSDGGRRRTAAARHRGGNTDPGARRPPGAGQ